jgi:hypothetical protein
MDRKGFSRLARAHTFPRIASMGQRPKTRAVASQNTEGARTKTPIHKCQFHTFRHTAARALPSLRPKDLPLKVGEGRTS